MSNFQKSNFNPQKHNLYHPKYPEKYKGDINKIISRSSYESRFYRWCDENPAVISWASEPFSIPYKDYTGKKRNYYPDVWFQCIDKEENKKTYLIEIKPYKETIPPKNHKRKKQSTLLYEQKTWETNKRKWNAARNLCKLKGWEFLLITEKQLFNK